MKICVTSQGDNLEAGVDPRFGRCQYFIMVDSDSLEFEAVKNPNIDSMGGAGIQSGCQSGVDWQCWPQCFSDFKGCRY